MGKGDTGKGFHHSIWTETRRGLIRVNPKTVKLHGTDGKDKSVEMLQGFALVQFSRPKLTRTQKREVEKKGRLLKKS